MTSEVLIASEAEVVAAVVAQVETEASRAVAARGRVSIALSGGSVATLCFPALAAARVDWSRCDFFWADERAVPADDPQSNFRTARELWFEPAGVPSSSIHRMPGARPDLDAAADEHAATLRKILGSEPALDIALLGMGPDGHVASLFPGHPALHDGTRLVLPIADSPKPPPRRLTLSLPVLVDVRRVLLIAFSASKADALAEALANPHSPLPVAQVLHRTIRPMVLADHEAGRRI